MSDRFTIGDQIAQGTSKFHNPLRAALDVNYFKAEPRSTLDWLRMIKKMSDQLPGHWQKIIPGELSLELISNYIANPADTRPQLTSDELKLLQEPQRVILWYFLKKLAQFNHHNEYLISEINNLLAEKLYRQKPLPAIPDVGIAVIDAEEDIEVVLPKGSLLTAEVEDEQEPRHYHTVSPLVGHTFSLNHLIVNSPVKKSKTMWSLRTYQLPLKQVIKPFRKVKFHQNHTHYQPGIVIQSTILQLQEGQRKIALSMQVTGGFKQPDDLQFFISTRGGWQELKSKHVIKSKSAQHSKLHYFLLSMGPEMEAAMPITHPNEAEHFASIQASLKILGIPLNCKIKQLKFTVKVTGIQPTTIRNQEDVANPEDNLLLFGLDAPRLAACHFGHPELAGSRIKKIAITPQWVAKPDNLSQYYKAYKKQSSDFTVAVSRHVKTEGGQYAVELANKKALFNKHISIDLPDHQASTETWDPEETDPLHQPVCYGITLDGADFGHSQYPLLMANYTIEKSKENNVEPTPVNLPYTPQISTLSINYETYSTGWQSTCNSQLTDDLRVLQITPFGYRNYSGEAIGIPEDQYGALYFGLTKVAKLKAASLYVHGLPGNARAAKVKVTWFYLSATGWKELPAHCMIFDDTCGLTKPGIFYWKPPQDISMNHSEMPPEYYWIKAVINPVQKAQQPTCQCVDKELPYRHGLMQITGLYTNAFKIVRSKAELLPLARPTSMPAGSALSLDNEKMDIPLKLPYATTDGQPPESTSDYWANAFNTVRNHHRMVSKRDFEDLFMQYFRSLSIVKCIRRKAWQDQLLVVVMPAILTRDLLDREKPGAYHIPRFAICELQSMENQMKSLASPFFQYNLRLKVVNPRFVAIGFKVELRFTRGATSTENTLQLYSDLQYFAMPWLFETGQSPQFSPWFEKGQLLTYLQGIKYIDAVFDVHVGLVKAGKIEFHESFEFDQDQILIMAPTNGLIVQPEQQEYMKRTRKKAMIGQNFIIHDRSNSTPDK